MVTTKRSGMTGVCWREKNKKWRAYIRIQRVLIHLGYFTELEDAKIARRKAETRKRATDCQNAKTTVISTQEITNAAREQPYP